jgi:adenylate kinase
MGPAGAGKSVQGKLFTDELGLAWISTGGLFRAFITGERRKELMSGKLLDDQEVIALVQKALANIDLKDEFVIDGFPRTIKQANWILDQVKNKKLQLTAVFNLVASKRAIQERLIQRGRDDDNPKVIKVRFEEFKHKTLPIIELFKENNIKVIDINADARPIEVHREIIGHLPEII